MTRKEFENTLKDLLALPRLDITRLLPMDGRVAGYDKIAGCRPRLCLVSASSLVAAQPSARVAAAAGEPDGHGFRIVIAAIGGAAAHAVVGRAAKFAAPDDERALEQAALLEISYERGDGLVHAADGIAVGALDVIVRVPSAVVELDEAHAFLDELAREQAFAAEGIRRVLADAVALLRLRVLL